MTWGKLLQPDLVLGDTVLSLTPDIVQQHHLRGLVLDVDETLVPFNSSRVAAELHHWLDSLRPHIQSFWLVSNNLSQNRIRSIADTLQVPFILGARKPSRRKLRLAVEAMDLPVQQIAMVGDRLFTDVLAGNRLGMFTILVEPMVDPNQVPRQYYVRNLEVWISQSLGVSLGLRSQVDSEL